MIKQFFKSLISNQEETQELVKPVFNITENVALKSDFEVTELSYEEYVRMIKQDRRQATSRVSHERRNPAHQSTFRAAA